MRIPGFEVSVSPGFSVCVSRFRQLIVLLLGNWLLGLLKGLFKGLLMRMFHIGMVSARYPLRIGMSSHGINLVPLV